MANTVLSYPIPPYQNLPIQDYFYKPSRFVISAITRGQTTIVTTTEDMNYVIAQLVRLIIPPSFGTRQLNNTQSYVLSIPSANQVELDINSSFMDPFIASSATTVAQILAIGDINNGYLNPTGRVTYVTGIPGSFTNIS